MCPSAHKVCSEPGGQKPVLSLSLDRIRDCVTECAKGHWVFELVDQYLMPVKPWITNKWSYSVHRLTSHYCNHYHARFPVVMGLPQLHIDGLVQDRRNPSALAMELRLSCINQSICPFELFLHLLAINYIEIGHMIPMNAFKYNIYD